MYTTFNNEIYFLISTITLRYFIFGAYTFFSNRFLNFKFWQASTTGVVSLFLYDFDYIKLAKL